MAQKAGSAACVVIDNGQAVTVETEKRSLGIGRVYGDCMRMLVMMLVLFLPIACSSKAAELAETAKFEELQNNKEHAAKLYREIIEKYPDSAQAKEAAERLTGLKEQMSGSGK